MRGRNCSREKWATAKRVEEMSIAALALMKEEREANKKPRKMASSHTGAAKEAKRT